jgi:hypothetical protein
MSADNLRAAARFTEAATAGARREFYRAFRAQVETAAASREPCAD